MKKSALTVLLSTFVLVLIFTLSGCNKSTSPTDNSNTDPTISNMVVADIQNDVSDVSDPSVDNNADMTLKPMFGDGQCFMRPAMGEYMSVNGFLNMVGIMRKLSLTADQKTSIQGFMSDYRSCIHTAQLTLRASEKTILDAANTQRKAIMAELKAGTITKAEARTQLAQLAKDTRTALKNNPDRATFQKSVCECLQTLFDKIKGILTGSVDDTTSQQYIWKTWVTNWVTKTNNTCITP